MNKTMASAVAACSVLAFPMDAAASIVTTGCARGAEAICTLQELYDGATVFVDEMAFWKWAFVDADDALEDASASVQFSERGRGVHLTFTGSGFFSHGLEGNYQFRYEVLPRAGAVLDRVNKFDLALLDYVLEGSGNADLRVGVAFGDSGVPLVDPAWLVEVLQFEGSQDETLYDSGRFDPALEGIVVSTRVSLSGSPGDEFSDPKGATIELNSFSQAFFRVPEPQTLLLVLSGALLLPAARSSQRPR